MDSNRNLCYFKVNQVKEALNVDDSYYETYNCQPNALGSFVTIDQTPGLKFLTICDIKVYGELVSDRGNFFFVFLNPTQNS